MCAEPSSIICASVPASRRVSARNLLYEKNVRSDRRRHVEEKRLGGRFYLGARRLLQYCTWPPNETWCWKDTVRDCVLPLPCWRSKPAASTSSGSNIYRPRRRHLHPWTSLRVKCAASSAPISAIPILNSICLVRREARHIRSVSGRPCAQSRAV